MTTEKFVPNCSIETTRLINLLKDGKPGDSHTRSGLSAAAKCSCETGEKGYGALQSAIKHCESQYGKVWRWSRANKRYECLDADGITSLLVAFLSSMHRRAGRAMRVAATVDREKLTPEKQREYDMNTLQNALVQQTSGSKMRNLIATSKQLEKLSMPSPDQIAKLFGPPQ